jgi:hypothetical protein
LCSLIPIFKFLQFHTVLGILENLIQSEGIVLLHRKL